MTPQPMSAIDFEARLNALETLAGTPTLMVWATLRMPALDAWRRVWNTAGQIAHEAGIDLASPQGEAFIRATWRAAERAEQAAGGGAR